MLRPVRKHGTLPTVLLGFHVTEEAEHRPDENNALRHTSKRKHRKNEGNSLSPTAYYKR